MTLAKDAIIRVGEGRGFLVKLKATAMPPLVLTAAHCLPQLPPAHPGSSGHERTYQLLGPLDGTPSVPAECLFVDPIADIAVLAEPDGQALCDEYEAYDRFVDGRPALRVAALTVPSDARLLTLSGEWQHCAKLPSISRRCRLS